MIGLLILIALIGVVAWLLVTYLPMPGAIRTAIIVTAVILVILLVLNATGILSSVNDVDVPRVRVD